MSEIVYTLTCFPVSRNPRDHCLQSWLEPGALCLCLFYLLTLLSSVWLYSQVSFLSVVGKIPSGSLRHAWCLGSRGGDTIWLSASKQTSLRDSEFPCLDYIRNSWANHSGLESGAPWFVSVNPVPTSVIQDRQGTKTSL